MRFMIASVAAASLVGAVGAQAPLSSGGYVVASLRSPPGANGAVLPGNSEVWLTVDREVSSKRLRQDASFPLSVSRDVMLGDYVVIPRGTPARGRISYRTGKGAFGKSAKMEFDLTDIDLPGRSIPVTGHYRIEGQGNTGATVGAAVAVGVFSAFVTGHSAVVNQGTEYRAFTQQSLPIVLAAAAAAAAAAPPRVVPAVAERPAASPTPVASYRNGRDDAVVVPMR